MTPVKLDIAFWDYDRGEPLRSGDVPIAGAEATFHSGRIVTDIFEAMISRRAYDVAELGLTYFLRAWEAFDAPFRLLPIPVARVFRHSAIYVNTASGIRSPADLAGKRIGELALYGHDAGLMAKGILSDEFGLKPEQCRWLVGGLDFPLERIEYVPQPVPTGVEVEWAAADVDLGELLRRGEIDALISADAPRCILEGASEVGQLFEDYPDRERDYFKRTGVFPIMHAVAVKRELAEERPELVRAIYDAFVTAKEETAEGYLKNRTFNNMQVMFPWLSALIGQDREVLGADWWPYGVAANLDAWNVVLRYHHEQGLTRRLFKLEEIVAPGLMDT